MSELNQNAEVVKTTLVATHEVYLAAYQGLSAEERHRLCSKTHVHEEFSTFGIAKRLGLSPGRARKELSELHVSDLNPNPDAHLLAHILEVALKMETISPEYRLHTDMAPLNNYLVTLFKDKSGNASNRNFEAVAILANRVNHLADPDRRKKAILQKAQKTIPVPKTASPLRTDEPQDSPPPAIIVARRKALLRTSAVSTEASPKPKTNWGEPIVRSDRVTLAQPAPHQPPESPKRPSYFDRARIWLATAVATPLIQRALLPKEQHSETPAQQTHEAKNLRLIELTNSMVGLATSQKDRPMAWTEILGRSLDEDQIFSLLLGKLAEAAIKNGNLEGILIISKGNSDQAQNWNYSSLPPSFINRNLVSTSSNTDAPRRIYLTNEGIKFIVDQIKAYREKP